MNWYNPLTGAVKIPVEVSYPDPSLVVAVVNMMILSVLSSCKSTTLCAKNATEGFLMFSVNQESRRKDYTDIFGRISDGYCLLFLWVVLQY
jgi:hypothetical protein